MTNPSPGEYRQRISVPDRLTSETESSARTRKRPRAMPPQPILFIHHANDMYGADIGLLHSIKSLDRQKYYPIVILPSDMPTGMLSPELDRLGVEFHFAHLGILRRKYLTVRSIIPLAIELLRGVAYVRSTARSRRVAIVYVNTFVPVSGAIGGKLAGVPVLWHIREILSMPRPVRWLLYKALSLCADRTVCISRAVRDSVLNEAPNLARKSVVVYNAVCVAASNGEGRDIGLREELKLPQSALLVGMVGRITHWKGQEILAEAAALVLREHPGVHFVAVGSYFADESHYLKKLKSLINSLGLDGLFHLVDYRSNVTDVYRALDVFVLPSIKPEPFGRVTVEAMAQGLAVIATNHGGTVELIEEGVTGMLVPPSNPHALAAAIGLLLRDQRLREKIGSAAAAYAKENFGLLRHGQHMRTIVDDLVVHNNKRKVLA
jgi:glycosyltransferase involved in cell wall biosynthesis